MLILYCVFGISQVIHSATGFSNENTTECPPPQDFTIAKVRPGCQRVGAVRTYDCLSDYQVMGEPTITCQKNLTWTPFRLACLSCPEPAAKFGCGTITAGENTLNTTRVYACGSRSQPASLTTTCLPRPHGPTWSEPTQKCSRCSSQNESVNPDPVRAFLSDCELNCTGQGEVACVDANGKMLWWKPAEVCTGAVSTEALVDYCIYSPCLNNGTCNSTEDGFECSCPAGYSGAICEGLKRDCSELLSSGVGNVTGVYTIQPPGSEKFQVVCDMDTDGGGWTVIQFRPEIENTIFNKKWNDYEKGFGTIDPAESFWLGLEKIYYLTEGGASELRMDIEKNHDVKAAAIYQNFSVTDKLTAYTLKIGAYSYDGSTGFVDPGDSFSVHNGAKFSAPDVSNAGFNSYFGYYECAPQYSGGWWYYETYCLKADLNGVTDWHTFNGYDALSKTKMMIRRKSSEVADDSPYNVS